MITHTVRSHGVKVARVHLHDWVALLLLAGIDIALNAMEPFHRFVGEDMLFGLKFPFKKHNTVPTWAVPVCLIFSFQYHNAMHAKCLEQKVTFLFLLPVSFMQVSCLS